MYKIIAYVQISIQMHAYKVALPSSSFSHKEGNVDFNIGSGKYC